MSTREKPRRIQVRCGYCGNLYWVREDHESEDLYCSDDCADMACTDTEPDYGGVLGADGMVYSDADSGL